MASKDTKDHPQNQNEDSHKKKDNLKTEDDHKKQNNPKNKV